MFHYQSAGRLLFDLPVWTTPPFHKSLPLYRSCRSEWFKVSPDIHSLDLCEGVEIDPVAT